MDNDMNSTTALVQSRFLQVAEKLGTDNNTAQKWTTALITRYTEPQRYYHTVQHVYSMLKCLEEHGQLVEDHISVKLAIFFHDWIYDPKGNSNELESIKYFNAFADEIGLSDSMRTLVAGYIERTITHTLPVDSADNDLRFFLDFDLEVLGRSDGEYAEYAAQIREEYSYYSGKDYCEGRIRVLKSFLGRPRLYFSDVFHERSEGRARANLGAEIKLLEGKLMGLNHDSQGCSP